MEKAQLLAALYCGPRNATPYDSWWQHRESEQDRALQRHGFELPSNGFCKTTEYVPNLNCSTANQGTFGEDGSAPPAPTSCGAFACCMILKVVTVKVLVRVLAEVFVKVFAKHSNKQYLN